MPRHLIAASIAAATIALGLFIRTHADGWSRDVVSQFGSGITVRKSYDKERHQLLEDFGAVLLGFGTLLAALSTYGALMPPAHALPPSSSPSGHDNG